MSYVRIPMTREGCTRTHCAYAHDCKLSATKRPKQYPYTPVRICTHCGKIHPLNWFNIRRFSSWEWARTNEVQGICGECFSYYTRLFADVSLRRCSYCGDLFRVEVLSKKWDRMANRDMGTTHGFIFGLKYHTCGEIECLRSYKLESEIPYKKRKLREFKQELTKLRKAIKGA